MSGINGGIMGPLNTGTSGMFTMDELPVGSRARPTIMQFDYAIIGGGGANTGNAGDNGGFCLFVSGETVEVGAGLPVVVGAIGGASSFNGKTANPGASNGNSGGVHWGWDASTNCDAWGGGSGGGPNGLAGTGGVASEYFAQGGNGGDGNLWGINNVWYAGGTPGLRSGAGTGSDGQPGKGASNFGGGNRAGGVIVSYQSETVLFTGGTVSSVGARVFHVFETSAMLTPV